jgi:hypothetical protein
LCGFNSYAAHLWRALQCSFSLLSFMNVSSGAAKVFKCALFSCQLECNLILNIYLRCKLVCKPLNHCWFHHVVVHQPDLHPILYVFFRSSLVPLNRFATEFTQGVGTKYRELIAPSSRTGTRCSLGSLFGASSGRQFSSSSTATKSSLFGIRRTSSPRT